MLFLVRERYPTFRADVDRLFFDCMLRRGYRIDFVMQAAAAGTFGTVPLSEHGRVLVGRTTSAGGFLGKIGRACLAFMHEARTLWRASSRSYECIQVKDKFVTAALGLLVARIKGLRFYYWLSFPLPEAHQQRARDAGLMRRPMLYLRGKLEEFLLYRVILPGSDHVFVQSQRMKEDLAARGVPHSKLTPVPMGIDLSQLAVSARDGRSVAETPDGLTIGYLGTLTPERRLTVLVDMLYCLLRDFGIAATLLIVGDGDGIADREAIEARGRQLKQQVTITGLLPRAEALERISTVDIAVSPFYPTPVLLSTSPTKIIEYMALGIPVVANEHPEQSEIIRSSGAGVCVPWGAEQFAGGVAALAKLSDKERAAAGTRGRLWVERYRSYERIADELDKVYRDLLAVPVSKGR